VDVSAVAVPSHLPPPLAAFGSLEVPPIFLFRALGRLLAFEGFLRVWLENEEKVNEGEEPQKLPLLKPGDALDLLELLTKQHFTQPPSRYTEASLIKAMEDRGIGRPSTYAAIMATLKARDYVLLEKRLLHPTSLGEATCNSLVAAFPQMMDYGFTAQVEDWLDDVSRGDIVWVRALRDFYTPFAQALQEAEAKMRAVPRPPDDGRAESPIDAGESPSRSRGKGSWSQRAKATKGGRPRGSKKSKVAPVKTSIRCPICGLPMVQRTGPRGQFLGCSTYPKCKGTRNIDTPEAANTASPVDATG